MAYTIKPQPGFQEDVLACTADIAIIGGSAGPGKTWCNLVEPLFHKDVKGFGCVMFRRSFPEIMGEGQLWDAASKVYSEVPGAKPTKSPTPTWTIGKAKITFAHLQFDDDAYNWLGSEIALIVMNELTSFTKFQFLFMLSRNRSTCGVKPYFRADCNPDPDSWVKEFVQWWIDAETGLPIPERNGVHRYLMVYKENYIWGDTKEEVRDKCPDIFQQPEYHSGEKDYRDSIKSVTFISGKLSENKILMKINPGYDANLLMQPEDIQKRMREGNWNSGGDGLGLYEKKALDDLFSNPVEAATQPVIGYDRYTGTQVLMRPKKTRRYITCDPARFGRDLCVIIVWEGWRVIHISIFKFSDTHDITTEIERLRTDFGVSKSKTMVDADGVGGETIKFGNYEAFHGGSASVKDPNNKSRNAENYKNLKTQCYYRMATRVNEGLVAVTLIRDTCRIFETPGKGIHGTSLSLKGKVWEVRDLIKADFKAIKRDKTEQDGGIYRKTINSKADQKIILNDRSPDFSDAMVIREAFELIRVFDDGGGIEVDF